MAWFLGLMQLFHKICFIKKSLSTKIRKNLILTDINLHYYLNFTYFSLTKVAAAFTVENNRRFLLILSELCRGIYCAFAAGGANF